MRKKLVAIGIISMLAVMTVLSSAVYFQHHAASPLAHAGPTVYHAIHHDVSAPLSSYSTAKAVRPGSTDALSNDKRIPIGHAGDRRTDTAIQPATHLPLVGTTTGLSFAGVGQGDYGYSDSVAPPDTNGAVGATQFVQWVNSSYAIFNKSTGALIAGPTPGNTLWSGFGGGCQTNNDGDPIVRYDQMANRWVLTQFSVTTTPYLQCVAVSTSSDATGTYNRYSFPYSNFNDYPKMGVWPDGYYIAFNLFNGNTFLGAQTCAFDRAKMLTGAAATQVCFSTSSSDGGLLPSDLDGSIQPAAGEPNFFMDFGTNSLNLWKFHVDFATPANSTFSGPTNIGVAAFSAACSGGGTCIPQAGTTNQVDSLADRLMYRLAYRKFADGHESLVVNHSVTAGSSVGVRWYEIRDPNGAQTVYQQSTYAPDATYRWMGSVAMDQSGDMALGYSASSSSIKPSIRYTGRLATDALNTMQAENTLKAGGGAETAGLSRWGDYSAMSVDPTDDCTFWYTTEYLKADGTFNWSTWIGSFKFASCGGPPPTNDFSISASPTSLSIVQGSNGTSTISTAVTSGSAGTVNLSTSVSPTGPTASVSPTSVTAGNSSTLTINVGASVAPGTYTVNVTGTEGTAVHSASVAVTVTPSGGGSGITNGGFETGSFSGWATGGAATSISTTAHSGTYAGQAGATTPTNGDSTIAQTFTVPTGSGTLSFWYKMTCPDSLTYDWATATLLDNTTSTSTTPLAKICTSNSWTQVSVPVTAGHSYTLTLISHDDNYSADPSYTLFDDVALAGAPVNDFSISASPTSLSIAQGSNGTSTISTAVTSGSAATVSLTASVSPAGPTVSVSPTSVTAGSSSTLTVTVGSSVATGSYTVTVTGTEGSKVHSTTVTVTVTAVITGGITNGGFETGSFSGWTTGGAATSISSTAHSGTHSGQAGATTPTNGDSTIAQTFTVPTGAHTLTFWYKTTCPDTVTYDWATATLKDNTTNTTTTPLAKICTNNSWTQVSVSVTAGHSYTLTLISHDDNYSGDPTYTLFDDIALS